MYVLMKILFKNSIKMKFNEKITSNLFGSVRLLTNSLNHDLFMIQFLGYKPSQKNFIWLLNIGPFNG